MVDKTQLLPIIGHNVIWNTTLHSENITIGFDPLDYKTPMKSFRMIDPPHLTEHSRYDVPIIGQNVMSFEHDDT